MVFSKFLPIGQIPVGCQLCEGRNKIEWKCTDCNLLMCGQSKDKVHLRIAKDHRIVNIKEIREHEDSWDSFVFSDLKCQDHPNQTCSLYCGTCRKVICLKCIVKVHNGHTFVDEEEFEDKKKKMQELQKKVKRNLRKLSSEKEKIMDAEETENLKHLKQDILDQKKKIHKAVDQYADNLVQDVDQHGKTLKQEEGTKIDQKIKNEHVMNEALESIITSRNFIKFFRDFDKLNDLLKEDMPQHAIKVSSYPVFVPGEFTVLNFGKLEESKGLREHRSQVELKVTNQWTTQLEDVHFIGRCPDGTLWIADNSKKVLQHIALEKDNVQVLSRFSIKIFGLSVDISSNILVSTFGTRLKLVDGRTQKVTDSVFDIAPCTPSDFLITKDQKVLISAIGLGGRHIVIVMDQTGNRLTEYEKDSNNKALFTSSCKLTSITNGNICVVDKLDRDFRGRVVVIGQAGPIKGIYTGHPDVNTEDKPFTPIDILATPSDNILVVDWKISVVHILNSDGDFISYYCVYDIEIQYPHSLALSTPGTLYIGCGCGEESPENYRAKLYKVEYSGI